MRSHICPKCQSMMIEGFTVTERSNMPQVSGWSVGTPIKGWWGVKNKGKPIDIAVWRCQRCGFLENYAKG